MINPICLVLLASAPWQSIKLAGGNLYAGELYVKGNSEAQRSKRGWTLRMLVQVWLRLVRKEQHQA